MANSGISIYLNDHLAGSVLWLDMMDSLIKAQSGTAMEQVLNRLRQEVIEDRQTLESVMASLKITESRTRKAMAWFGEKISELKLQVDDSEDLHLLQSLELLILGIEGRSLLWRALAVVASEIPVLQGVHYDVLLQRAEMQHRQLESLHADIAKGALWKAN